MKILQMYLLFSFAKFVKTVRYVELNESPQVTSVLNKDFMNDIIRETKLKGFHCDVSPRNFHACFISNSALFWLLWCTNNSILCSLIVFK